MTNAVPSIPDDVWAAPTFHDDCAFIQARDNFLALLAPSERAGLSSCVSLQDLIQNLEKFQQIRNGGSRVKRALAKINAFGQNLVPYFHIMETFCGAHPEWANIALGSLQLVLQVCIALLEYLGTLSSFARLLSHIYETRVPQSHATASKPTDSISVLQLASHYITFFEKLCDVVENLNLRLSRYQEVYESLNKQPGPFSPALKSSFERVYCHLFEFYSAVARIFSKKCGSMLPISLQLLLGLTAPPSIEKNIGCGCEYHVAAFQCEVPEHP